MAIRPQPASGCLYRLHHSFFTLGRVKRVMGFPIPSPAARITGVGAGRSPASVSPYACDALLGRGCCPP